MFDVLGSLAPVDGLRVLDLFAGSGALGIEALSRGALSAVFVDRDADAVSAVRANLDALGLDDRALVVRAEVLRWLEPVEPGDSARSADLALCDPPYDFDEWAVLLGRLRAPLVVLESSQPVEVPPPWEVVRQKRYGGTLVTVARRGGREPTTTAQDDQKGSP